jgi:hypothetical protein
MHCITKTDSENSQSPKPEVEAGCREPEKEEHAKSSKPNPKL